MSVQAITWAFSRNVDPGPKLLLLALANYANDAGRCFPSKARLAADCNLSERSIRNYLLLLEQQDLVVVEANFDRNGRQTANTIRLNMEGANPAREGANPASMQTGAPSGVHLRAPLMNRHKEPSEEIDSAHEVQDLLGDMPAQKPSKPTEPEGFSDFMAIFPKRDHSHPRKPTMLAFVKASKKANPQDIIAGAARFAAYCDREHKTGTQFVPMAATWLNQERWTISYDLAPAIPHNNTSRKPTSADEWDAAADRVRARRGIPLEGSGHDWIDGEFERLD